MDLRPTVEIETICDEPPVSIGGSVGRVPPETGTAGGSRLY
jgi:hypothetical protein